MFAPGEILFFGLDALAPEGVGDGEHAFGGVSAAVENDILAGLAQFKRNLLIDLQRARIDDAHVHASIDGVEEEHAMHGLAHGVIAAEGEGEVGDAAGHMGMGQTRADFARRLNEVDAIIVMRLDARRDGEDIGIEDDVFRGKADLLREHLIGALAYLDLAGECVGLARLIKGHHDDSGAITAHHARLFNEFRLALLERNGVHHRLALNALEAGFNHLEFRGIDHDGRAGDVGFGGHEMQIIDHGLLRIQQALVHIDVDDLRAIGDLFARDIEGGGIFAVLDEFAEARGARDIGALAHIHKANVLREREGLKPRQAQHGLNLGRTARAHALHAIRKGGDMLRRRAAASPDDVDEAAFSEFAQHGGHIVGALVIEAEFIGQARIGIGERECVGDARNLRHMLAKLARAERAVEADREGIGMAQRMPEGRRRLAREGAARKIRDGAGEQDRQARAEPVKGLPHAKERGLGVQSVEDGFKENCVGAAFNEGLGSLAIGKAQLVEGDRAKAGVVHIRRDRRGAVGGADGAADKATAAILRFREVRRLAGKARASAVEVPDIGFKPVISLRDGGRGEGVGLHEVCAREKIFQVNVADGVGLGEVEEIVVAAQVALCVFE